MLSISCHFFLACVLLLVCVGCTVPTLENPLVDPSQARAFPGLLGAYRTDDCPDNIVHYAHVGPAGDGYPDGFIRIISVSQPRDAETALRSEAYVGFVVPIGGFYILHIPLSKATNVDGGLTISDQNWDRNQIAGYFVLRLLAGPDGIEMSGLNEHFIAEQIAKSRLAGRVTQPTVERDGVVEVGERVITITADEDELRQFFTRHVDGDLFRDPDWKFTRVR